MNSSDHVSEDGSGFAGSALGALGTSTGATGAKDDNFDSLEVAGSKTGAASDPRMPDVDPSSIRAVFFDLDGTLLPMDLDEFLNAYFKAIGTYVHQLGYDTASFSAGFSRGLKAMGHHDPSITNAQAFWGEFFECVSGDQQDWSDVILRFYTQEFPKLGADVVPNPACAHVVNVLASKGYPLVLATMPYFPLPAVLSRLSWAGVDASLFARLTHYENSRSAKPGLHYYAEQLVACGIEANEILMVGNNTVEDLSFSQMGAHVFITTDYLLNPSGVDLADVEHGSMEQFARWVDDLPACANPCSAIGDGLVDEAPCARFLEML